MFRFISQGFAQLGKIYFGNHPVEYEEVRPSFKTGVD